MEGELNAFVPKKERTTLEKFIVKKTSFGWRLEEFPWQKVLMDAAKNHVASRKWVPGNREKFEAAIARSRK